MAFPGGSTPPMSVFRICSLWWHEDFSHDNPHLPFCSTMDDQRCYNHAGDVGYILVCGVTRMHGDILFLSVHGCPGLKNTSLWDIGCRCSDGHTATCK